MSVYICNPCLVRMCASRKSWLWFEKILTVVYWSQFPHLYVALPLPPSCSLQRVCVQLTTRHHLAICCSKFWEQKASMKRKREKTNKRMWDVYCTYYVVLGVLHKFGSLHTTLQVPTLLSWTNISDIFFWLPLSNFSEGKGIESCKLIRSLTVIFFLSVAPAWYFRPDFFFQVCSGQGFQSL